MEWICCHGWTFQENGLTDSDKCTASTAPSPNCVPLAHVRWNVKWCRFSLKETDMSTKQQFQHVWHRDLNSSYFFPRFGLLEHEANKTPDISATFIGSRKSFVNTAGCLFVRQENESRVFCLSPTGWIVWIGAAEEELYPFKFCAEIWSAPGI